MKIAAICRRCDRNLLVEQSLELGGRCPWCGKSFQPDYAAVLVDALRDAEAAGATLENALEKIAELGPAFRLDADSVLSRIRDYVERLSR